MYSNRPQPAERIDPRTRVMIGLMVVGFIVSAFALALAFPLVLLRRFRPREFVAVLIVGLIACAVLGPFAFEQTKAAGHAFAHPGTGHVRHKHRRHRRHHRTHHRRHHHRAAEAAGPKLPDWGKKATSAWPHVRSWWLLMLGCAPALALLMDLVRPKSLVEEQRRRERSGVRGLERKRRRALQRAASAAAPSRSPAMRGDVVLLGAKVSDNDERALPERRGSVGLELSWMRKPMLVIGPTGSGKSETVMRLAWGAATVGRMPVYYFDAKADRRGAERFDALMAAAGHRCAVFPDTPIDCWRGDGAAIYNRLIALPAFATEGDGAFYRDVAKRCLQLACCGTAEPPRSSAELLERLRPDSLAALDHHGELQKLGTRELASVALRYASFFESVRGSVDSGVGFEDVDAAYVMLDSLALREDAHSLARLLVEDFAHFATQRKPFEQPALLIVDELSAIADAARVTDLVERMRSYNVGVVLAPQVESGISDDVGVADRIVQNSETVILHALKRPERIIELAGTRLQVEASYQHDRGTATGMGSGQAQHVYKIDPNEVRALAPGECFVIRRGGVVRVQVARAPEVPTALRMPVVRKMTSREQPAPSMDSALRL